MVLVSHDLVSTTRVHNSLHCKGLDCSWDLCHEYTFGDHFLLDISVPDLVLAPSCKASEKPPSGWDDQQRWLQGFSENTAVCQALSALIEPLCAYIERLPCYSRPPRRIAEWLADASACVLATIEGLVRDGWVLAAQVPVTKRRRRTVSRKPLLESWLDLRDCSSIDEWFASDAQQQAEPILQSCLKWLKPLSPSPPLSLSDPLTNASFSPSESHQQWILAIKQQFAVPSGWDQDFHQIIERKAAGILGMELRAVGKDPADVPISQSDWLLSTASWESSPAITPDLLPRCLFEVPVEGWSICAWLCMRLCGPACLAVRPEVWRWKRIKANYKKGPSDCAASYRLITVVQNHGLLQEYILFSKVAERVQNAISCFQSGFVKDVADPHFCFHEICSIFLERHQPLLAFFADLVKAFPRSWRASLSTSVHSQAGLRGGAMVLLASILKSDTWLLPLSGLSWVEVVSGVPEGCRIGPPLFNFLPDTLVTSLLENKCGVSWTRPMPKCWKQHIWSGSGAPHADTTQRLLTAIQSGSPLPTADMLARDPDLEASAARALDLSDPYRIPVLLHADDPLFLASSKGELRRMLQIIAAWSKKYKACLHVSNSKSVVMLIAGPTQKAVFEPNAFFLYQSFTMPAPVPLQTVDSHKWLGLMWDFQSTLERHALMTIAAQQSKVAMLAGMVQGGSLPLSVALHLFEIKINASLRFGRWLWGLSPISRARLDDAQRAWARTILGAEPWRNSAVNMAELGWHMTGSAQCVLDVASRRARLWNAADSSLAGTVFTMCDCFGSSWTTRSKLLLLEWGLLDWPVWCSTRLMADRSLEAYTAYCKLHLTVLCQSKLLSELSCHTAPVLYSSLPEPPFNFAQHLPWEALRAVLSLVKFRAGHLRLGHVEGKPSQANVQHCIACERRYSAGALWHHVWLNCSFFEPERRLLRRSLGKEPQANEVWTPSTSEAFADVLLMAKTIHAKHKVFWKRI